MRAALVLALTTGAASAEQLPLIHCPGHPRCFALVRQTDVHLPSPQGSLLITLPDLPAMTDPDARLRLADKARRWWHDHNLIALSRTETTGYSGGGAAVETLLLLRPGAPTAKLVLTLPVSASKTIRACFSEADTVARNDHCADLYDFEATLTPLPQTGTPPSLSYDAQATIFPPGAGLDQDNTALPAPEDAEPAPDADCTFTRTFHWDAATASYTPDTPLPDCSAYWAL